MSELIRFGVSADEKLIESFDRLISSQGYANRSEALRDLMRDSLIRSRVENQNHTEHVLGTLTLVYDHHAHELTDQMAEIQHARHELVISVLHVHISHDDCMEVIVLKGGIRELRALSGALLSLKGVKHGKLFVTLPSQQITANARTHKHAHSRTHN